jgi:uncharacterized membrane protein YfcA
MDTAATWFYPVLFVTGLVAGFVDSIAGGGGLITVPVLLSTGMLPQDALGTNKLQATFGSGSAAFHFTHAGLVRLNDCIRGIAFTAIGAAAGTMLVVNERVARPELLKLIIPWLLIALAIYLLVRPALGSVQRKERMTNNVFHLTFGLLIGFYDGFFGPGTGTFWAMAYVMFLGYELTQATAHTKVMNFTSNIASLVVFVAAGHVLPLPGIVMGIGQMLGARLGSRAVIKRGANFIRPIFLTVVIAIASKLLWDYFRAR